MRLLRALTAVLVLLMSACSQQVEGETQSTEPLRLLSGLPPGVVDESRIRMGQTIYVPSYSQVLLDPRRRMPLTVSLTIRNTDADHSMLITQVRYYASSGELVSSYLGEGPRELAPMASATQLIERMDVRGGEGANFIVEWVSEQRMTPPIVEAVMVSAGTQGISLITRGEVIGER